MKACGLIVEYNPFHNGHRYHAEEAKKLSEADILIAVMSGSFLQRGEPAIIDKFHRTKAALISGIDIVVELPFPFAVQSSELFAKGAIQTLYHLGSDSICFGSESGNIDAFINSYKRLQKNYSIYEHTLKNMLKQGFSFPVASQHAYQKIGLLEKTIDVSKPNNILGFSYVKEILDNHLSIQPLTIKRIKNEYHEQEISHSISSATSIRKELFEQKRNVEKISHTMPPMMLHELQSYSKISGKLHRWEDYFQFVYYRVMTMNDHELHDIAGMDEGIEYRIRKTAKQVLSFHDWLEAVKTKRYTWTRIQRLFVYLLTNTKKFEMAKIKQLTTVPYIRLLGITKRGREYLHTHKKQMEIPIISSMSREMNPLLSMEERASQAYYSILPPRSRIRLMKQELEPPIIL